MAAKNRPQSRKSGPSPFDDLPSRDRSHEVEEAALVAFQQRLADSRAFILQGPDRNDYGTDRQIEVIENGHPANARVHVQLKGTERAFNADGSLSVKVRRANLNYLLMQEYSFYACFHVPSGSLRFCPVARVLRQYEHSGTNWMEQETLTVSFTEDLTIDHLAQLADLVRAGAKAARDRRIGQFSVPPADLPKVILRAAPDVHVPEDAALAGRILQELYEKGADDVISAAFDRFAAILGAGSDAMVAAYMAEINLGMTGPSQFRERIEDGIDQLRSKIGKGRIQTGSLQYSIGNGFSALGDEEQAKLSYEAALSDPALQRDRGLAAQCHKNLGTSFERLGDQDQALEHFRKALKLSPDLAEAHNALGIHCVRLAQYEEALKHFDRAVFVERSQGKTSAVAGWRANVLFNLGDDRAAFREINGLVSQADSADWIWPRCARLVANFGRTSLDNADQALPFWRRYVRAHPDHSPARRELLLTTFFLRTGGRDIGRTYADFREEFDRHIAHVDLKDAALPWDRLGHWAQADGDWAEAARCFRKAYDLEGGHYGYCLGTALNHLERYEESLPLLVEQATSLQPDDKSWFQVGVACAHLGRAAEAADAYEKALALNPDYDLAMFNLGGVYWNDGDLVQALEIWNVASVRFSDHELAARLKRDMPLLFGPDSGA